VKVIEQIDAFRSDCRVFQSLGGDITIRDYCCTRYSFVSPDEDESYCCYYDTFRKDIPPEDKYIRGVMYPSVSPKFVFSNEISVKLLHQYSMIVKRLNVYFNKDCYSSLSYNAWLSNSYSSNSVIPIKRKNGNLGFSRSPSNIKLPIKKNADPKSYVNTVVNSTVSARRRRRNTLHSQSFTENGHTTESLVILRNWKRQHVITWKDLNGGYPSTDNENEKKGDFVSSTDNNMNHVREDESSNTSGGSDDNEEKDVQLFACETNI